MRALERFLLALFPSRFRSRFRSELTHSLREAMADAATHTSPAKRWWRRAGVLADFVRTALAERFSDGAGQGGLLLRGVADCGRDLRFAFRQLRTAPGFAATVVLTMALATGANTAVFTVLHGVLLAPLPFENPDRLIYVWGAGLGPESVDAWRAGPGPLEGATLVEADRVVLSGDGPAERARALYADPDFLEVLGARPLHGRWFRDGDVAGPPAVVLRDDEARRRFGTTEAALGRDLIVNGVGYRIVGILPAEVAASVRPSDASLWLPMEPSPSRYQVIGRLRAGMDLETARRTLAELFPSPAGRSGFGSPLQMESLHEILVSFQRRVLTVLYGGVAIVLLLAFVNVAHLFLVRFDGRLAEMSIRASLGAGRGRLARQLLMEALAVAALGTAGGLLLASPATRILLALAPEHLPRAGQVGPGLAVLGYSAALMAVGTAIFILLPALFLRRADLHPTRAAATVTDRRRARSLLLVTQVTLTVLVLGAAGLVTRTLVRLDPSDPGFDPSSKLVFNVSLPDDRYADPLARTSLFERMRTELTALPGIRAVEATTDLPFAGTTMIFTLEVDGQVYEGRPTVHTRVVSSGYLEMLRVPTVRGESPGGGVADRLWINESAAGVLFPGSNAVGRWLSVELDRVMRPFRVAGVVADTRIRGTHLRSWPEVFVPLEASPSSRLSFVVATEGTPETFAPEVGDTIAAIDPLLPVEALTSFEGLLRESMRLPRFNATLMLTFAAITLLLACVGVFGVVSRGVEARRRELGIRLALGADAGAIARLVYGRTLLLLGVGMAIGIGGVLLGGQWLETLLFGFPSADPFALAIAASFMLVAGTAAASLPVLRATRTDPTLSMRED